VLPDGRLPVFSVDTEKEAEALIVMACPRDDQGAYYARELAGEQTLENLVAFSDKLQECQYFMMKMAASRKKVKA
jgi:hypothetical protein